MSEFWTFMSEHWTAYPWLLHIPRNISSFSRHMSPGVGDLWGWSLDELKESTFYRGPMGPLIWLYLYLCNPNSHHPPGHSSHLDDILGSHLPAKIWDLTSEFSSNLYLSIYCRPILLVWDHILETGRVLGPWDLDVAPHPGGQKSGGLHLHGTGPRIQSPLAVSCIWEVHREDKKYFGHVHLRV